jgi:putative colanic acid biosynthesis glycosyltransferase WcaI
MNVLFISNHFSLPGQPGAPRPWAVARYLSRRGHKVTVITNKRHYLDENIKIGGEGADIIEEIVEGVRIISVETTPGRRKSLAKRLINYGSYTLQTLRVSMRLEVQDVIIVGTPPLLVPLTGILAGIKHRAMTILEIRDIYPETAVALGKIKSTLLIRIWDWFENCIRKKYDHIVAVVPRIRQILLEKDFSGNRVSTITNGYERETDDIENLPDSLENFWKHHFHKFKVVYGGGMGHGINLMTVLEVAKECRGNSDIIFLFFGEGDLKGRYERFAADHALANTFFFPPQKRTVIKEVFKRADALVHSFIADDFFRCALPNKIFEYHAAGKPILFAGVGDTADLINRAGSGIVVEPENVGQLKAALLQLVNNPDMADKMGSSGSVYIRKHYDRMAIFKKWDSILEHRNSMHWRVINSEPKELPSPKEIIV